MSVAVGMALAPAGARAQSAIPDMAPAQAPAFPPSRVHTALRTATECYRRGDYEQAALYFKQAKAGEADLTAEERQGLAQWLQLNGTALQAQREGAAELLQAELAVRQGRTQDALALVKTVTPNQQFLRTTDKQKLQQLTAQLMPDGSSPASYKGGDSVATAQARSKLKQARMLMRNGNLQAAQSLAFEASELHAIYSEGEDTPVKVLEDINQARTAAAQPQSNDAKGLLTAARAALARGDLDRAEQLARQADRAGSLWTIKQIWGDSPGKVLKDVERERSRLAGRTGTTGNGQQVSSTQAMKPFRDSGMGGTTGDNTEVARRLIHEARAALQAGNYAQAKQQADRARQLKPQLDWYEDNPDKVLADISKAEGGRSGSDGKRSLAADTPSTDPRLLIKQGRQLYSEGKLDDAEKLAIRAGTMQNVRWGWLEDTPEKLLKDVRARNQERSWSVLAEARKQYEHGNLDEAKRLAHQARRMHGQYNLWELGDRPDKLLAEIDQAEVKNRGRNAPPAPTLARAGATVPANPANPGSGSTTWPVIPQQKLDAGPAIATDGKKAQAQLLLAQARQFQRESRLLEARQKALEAQRVGAVFSPDEDRPEAALLHISAQCQKQIDTLVQQASEAVNAASRDPRSFERAETSLTQARQLAVSFGFDSQAIDAKLTWVLQAEGKGTTTSTGAISQMQHQEPPAPAAPAAASASQGQTLLSQARMELRAGQMANARRLAEAAFDIRYGVQAEAAQLLRSIDAEEFNQKVLAASRTYDAGFEAYYRRDYARAVAILRTVDPQLLPPDRQARLRDALTAPQMQSSGIALAGIKPDTGNQPGRASVSDQAPGNPVAVQKDFAKEVLLMQQVRAQKMRQDGLTAMRDATKMFDRGDTDQALDLLRSYNTGLASSGLDPDQIAKLRGPVDARLHQLELLKHNQDAKKLLASQHETAEKAMLQQALVEETKKKQLAELMKKYHEFYSEAKYDDAYALAMRAHELDPDNVDVNYMVHQAEMRRNVATAQKNNHDKENLVLDQLNQTDREGPSLTIDNPLAVNREAAIRNKDRRALEILGGRQWHNERERTIYRKLDDPISSMDYRETPLRQILEDLQGMTGINIVPDEPAMREAGIPLTQQVTMKLEGITLKSALKLVLQQVHLTYVVEDEVLKITTEEHSRGKLMTKVYPVAELVLPIDNAPNPFSQLNAMQAHSQGADTATLKTAGVSPYVGVNGLGGANTPNVSQLANAGANAPTGTPAPGWAKESNRTTEEVLMRLITNTVAPQSWSNVGGPATIDFFPLGLALVINQTPDIQEQVAELLAALRRLQDQEVAIEVRFITVAESFFERIGVNFNVNFRNNQTRYEPQIVSQQFKPFGFINNFNPTNFISGLTPAGSFTQDLNIPLNTSSFNMAIPPFGSYPNIPGSNGGISMGLAFLSDIEVFLFMEAAQGDQRTNVMQAPKLTMFNGQTATLTVTDTEFFVTAVTVTQAGGQVVFSPVNVPFPTGGVTLTLLPTISADRRFVRVSLAPALFSLTSAVVPLFPITTFITPVFEGGAVGQPIPFTQFIQQPAFNTITANTTVNVPDGGTVLLGGLKRLSEGRNEFGPPILSKIPYLNRLFKNVGYGREAESLMIMVTPRIIINEEEEARQVPGIVPGPGVGQ
jgi:type II secretory pathway component GspD/PulD (secretin)